MVISAKKRFEILMRDWFACQYCGKRGKDVSLEVDHITPKALWWTDKNDNLICCCRECNMWKWKTGLTKQRFELNNSLHIIARERIYDFYNERNAHWLWTIDDNTRRLLTMFFRNWALNKRFVWREAAAALFWYDNEDEMCAQLWFDWDKHNTEWMDVEGIQNILSLEDGLETLLDVAEWGWPQRLEMDLLHNSEQWTVFNEYAWWKQCLLFYSRDKNEDECEEWYNHNIYELSPCERLNFWISIFWWVHFDPIGLNTKIMEGFSLFPNFLRRWQLI